MDEQDRSLAYEKELHAKSQVIRETEMRNMNKKERSRLHSPDDIPRLDRSMMFF
jgi:hypothetical protein